MEQLLKSIVHNYDYNAMVQFLQSIAYDYNYTITTQLYSFL